MTYPQLPVIIGPKGKPEGLDWDALRAENLAQLERQAAAGVDDDETKAYVAEKAGLPVPKPKPKGRDPFANGGRSTGKPPQYDRKRIVEMYVDQRMTVAQIAAHFGCHSQTIRNNLKAAKVALRDDRLKS